MSVCLSVCRSSAALAAVCRDNVPCTAEDLQRCGTYPKSRTPNCTDCCTNLQHGTLYIVLHCILTAWLVLTNSTFIEASGNWTLFFCRRLRSASSHQVSVPHYRLSTYGRLAFSVAGPDCLEFIARRHAGSGVFCGHLQTVTEDISCCLSNALHSSVGQNIKSRACPMLSKKLFWNYFADTVTA